MTLTESIVGPIAGLIDRIIPEADARDRAKLELLRLESTGELGGVTAELDLILADARSADPWTNRARPAFLYVMYALVLWSLPMGLLAAVRPNMAAAIAHATTAYLSGIPEPMWALFGTGYLGYTAARTWGKVKRGGVRGLPRAARGGTVSGGACDTGVPPGRNTSAPPAGGVPCGGHGSPRHAPLKQHGFPSASAAYQATASSPSGTQPGACEGT